MNGFGDSPNAALTPAGCDQRDRYRGLLSASTGFGGPAADLSVTYG